MTSFQEVLEWFDLPFELVTALSVGGLIAGFGFFTIRFGWNADTYLREERRNELMVLVQNVSNNGAWRRWPELVYSAFVGLLGQNPLSVDGVLRSVGMTTVTIVTVSLIASFFNDGIRTVIFYSETSLITTLRTFWALLLVNYLADYISFYETRYFLGLAKHRVSGLVICLFLLIDIAVTLLIYMATLAPTVFLADYGNLHLPFDPEFHSGDMYSPPIELQTDAQLHLSFLENPDERFYWVVFSEALALPLIFSTFLTTLWTWMLLIMWLLSSAFSGFNKALWRVFHWVDIPEDRPTRLLLVTLGLAFVGLGILSSVAVVLAGAFGLIGP